MALRSRTLLVALMASTIAVPAVAYAAKAKAPTVKPILTEAPEMLDPSVMETPLVDVDAEMTAGPAQAAEQTLFDALRWSYENNPTIRAARAELLATQERLPQAEAGWKPTATGSASVSKNWIDTNPSTTADGSTSKALSASISQPLYRGGRTISDTDSAKNVIMAQRAFLNQTEANVLLNVATAYMNVLRDQSLYDLAMNNHDVIAKQRDAVKARFDVGDVTRTDVAQSESRLADAESGLISARGNLRSSLAFFQNVVGTPPGHLSFPKAKPPIPDNQDDTIKMALNYNPAVLASKFLHDAAQSDIKTVFGELLPSVSLVAGTGKTWDPSPGTLNSQTASSIGVEATIPLYEAGSVRSRVRQARSISSQRLIQVEDAERFAQEQAISSWEDLQAAVAEIDSRRSQVKAAAVAREGVHKEAELGTRTVLDALDSDRELVLAQSALVTARRNEIVARYALASTLGLLTPNGLGFAELSRDYNEHIKEIEGKVFSTTTKYTAAAAQPGSRKQ